MVPSRSISVRQRGTFVDKERFIVKPRSEEVVFRRLDLMKPGNTSFLNTQKKAAHVYSALFPRLCVADRAAYS